MLLFFSGLWCLPSPYSLPHVAHAPYCTVFHCRAPGCQIPAVEQAFVERTLCAHSPPSCVTGCQALGSDPILSWGPCSNQLDSAWMCVCSVVCVCVCAPSYSTLWGPMDCSSPGSSVHEISQTRRLEWIVISYSRESSWPRDRIHISCIGSRFFTTSATWEAQIEQLCYVLKSYVPQKLRVWTSLEIGFCRCN